MIAAALWAAMGFSALLTAHSQPHIDRLRGLTMGILTSSLVTRTKRDERRRRSRDSPVGILGIAAPARAARGRGSAPRFPAAVTAAAIAPAGRSASYQR